MKNEHNTAAVSAPTFTTNTCPAVIRALRPSQRPLTGEEVRTLKEMGYTRLHLAVMADDYPFAAQVLESGVNANIPDGQSSVLPPILFCHSEGMLQLLIEHKALVNIATEDGESPLRNAVEQMDVDMVQALLEAGADPNFPSGKTRPLHLADDIELVRLLVEAGADVNAEDEQGRRPLDRAIQPDIKAYLAEQGAEESK